MRRFAAGHAEVVHAADKALSEQVLPDAIDHHARRQWVPRVAEPLRQFESAALLRIDLRRIGDAHRREKPARNSRSEFLRLAANADLRVADHLALAHSQRDRPSFRRIGQREQIILASLHLLVRGLAILFAVGVRSVSLLEPQFLQFLACLGQGFLRVLDLRGQLGVWLGPGTEPQEHLRVVVGQPRAAHLVAQSRRTGRCYGRCPPGRNILPKLGIFLRKGDKGLSRET